MDIFISLAYINKKLDETRGGILFHRVVVNRMTQMRCQGLSSNFSTRTTFFISSTFCRLVMMVFTSSTSCT